MMEIKCYIKLLITWVKEKFWSQHKYFYQKVEKCQSLSFQQGYLSISMVPLRCRFRELHPEIGGAMGQPMCTEL